MPNSPQSNATLIVNKSTGAIEAPVDAATFAAANDLATAGAPEAHAASHAAAGSDPVTLAQSQITNLTTDLGNKQPLATVLTNTTAAFTTAQETKLAGIATGATANSSDATLLARANHTGTQSADTITDGTTNKAFLATERTKLAGIEAGAQANVALASQAEAEGGTEATKTMTPLRVAQAIAALESGSTTAADISIADAGDYFTATQVEAALQEAAGQIVALQNTSQPSPTGNALISGGGVALVSDLTINVSAATYRIQGTEYNSAETELVAGTADPTNPRIDVVAVNTSGAAVLITGTPAATPVKPDVDPTTQLELTFFNVPASATALETNVVDVYRENTEYTMTENGTSITLNSTNNPHAGTTTIEATGSVAGDYFQAQAPAPIDLGDFDSLVFFIRSKAAWANAKQLTITARSSGTQVGSAVVFKNGLFSFDSSNTTTYQQIVIPASLFSANGQSVNQIRWAVAGGGGAIGFYVDDITLQGGLSPVADATRVRDRGGYSADLLYAINDMVDDAGILYVGIQAGMGKTPASNPTYWRPRAMLNPMTNVGDLIIGGSSGTPIRLAAGSEDDVMKIVSGVPAWAAGGGGGTPGGSNTEVQFNNAGAFGASANFTYAASTLKLINDLAANTVGNALALFNTTAASSGNQRHSPRLILRGNSWSGAASQDVRFNVEALAITGGRANFAVSSSLNGGADEYRLLLKAYENGLTELQLNSTAAAAHIYQIWGVNSTAVVYSGIVGAANGLVTGSAAEDYVLRWVNSGKRLLFSFDNGSSVGASIGSGNITLAAATSSIVLGSTTITSTSGALSTASATSFTDATDASSTAAAAVMLSGGIAVTKKAYIGDGVFLGTTTPGNISGNSGAITIASSGTDQNINLNPIGAGRVVITAPASNVQLLRLNVTTTTGNLYNAIGYEIGGTAKAYVGVVVANDVLITGSLANDFCVREQGGNVNFSTDSGTTIGFQVVAANGGIKTSAPSGGTAAAWKLGTVATVSPTSPNRTIELDVAGTRYFIHAKTTND